MLSRNLIVVFLVITCSSYAQQPGQVIVHDPVLISADDKYYLFATGDGIDVWSSTDLENWSKQAPVFPESPAWAKREVPTFKGHIWAPDIHYFNGLYYLYYSISAFGKNTSCIGLATNPTLNPQDSGFKWTDRGKVIQSIPGKTNWNAIDPNLVFDESGHPFLAFGSFWDGIKLVRLSRDGMRTEDDLLTIPTLASRKINRRAPNPPAIDNNPVDAGGNAVEAPFIFKRGGYYYLFASIDYCCKGAASTYKMIVGRAKKVTGPYLDDQGKDLASAGGKLLLAGDSRWHGVGHNAVIKLEEDDYLGFHGYDAQDQGKPKLRIEKLKWDNKGWPLLINNELSNQ